MAPVSPTDLANASPSNTTKPPLSTGSSTDCSQVNCYYVRAGASGANSGADWNNAYPALPATLMRDALYFVAGGSYPSWTFNTPESGTSVVTVKKAAPSDHGTQTGWAASYGTTQAVFSSQININRGYFIFDGQYRNESNWFDGPSYGFKIANNGAWDNLVIRNPDLVTALSNVTIGCVYIAAIVGSLPAAGSGERPYGVDTWTFNSSLYNSGYVFSHLYVEGSCNSYFLDGLINPVLEYSASRATSGSSTYHGEVVNLYYSFYGGGVVRFNHFKDSFNGASGYSAGGGTGVIAIAYSSTKAAGSTEIYGNIFENYQVGDGAVAADAWTSNNIHVYNNTFINGAPQSPTVGLPNPSAYPGVTGVGNAAFNNLVVGSAIVSFYGSSATFGNNSTDTASVFVNYAAGDFRLARHTTTAGTSLPSPFNVDIAGNIRGDADGFWDIGAYQFK